MKHERLGYVIFTFIKPTEEMFVYSDKKGDNPKEHLDEYERWIHYYNQKGYVIRTCIKTVIQIAFLLIVLSFIVRFMYACEVYKDEKKREKEELNQLNDNRYRISDLISANDEFRFFKQQNLPVFFVCGVKHNEPLVVTSVNICGCDYFVWRNNGRSDIMMTHRGDCKSPVHKR